MITFLFAMIIFCGSFGIFFGYRYLTNSMTNTIDLVASIVLIDNAIILGVFLSLLK